MFLPDYFWNNPLYKPKSKIHPDFWEEFMRAMYIIRFKRTLRIADPLDKDPNKSRDLDIYDVFNFIRQESLSGQPYSKKRLEHIDAAIEKEFARDANKLSYESARRD